MSTDKLGVGKGQPGDTVKVIRRFKNWRSEEGSVLVFGLKLGSLINQKEFLRESFLEFGLVVRVNDSTLFELLEEIGGGVKIII